MTPSSNCLAIIQEFEGLKLKAYLCPAKVWTIGFGSTGPDITRGTVWTRKQADDRLKADVERFAAGVAKIAAKTTQGQFDALVSFAYNCGLSALASSTLLKRHLAGDPAGAAAQFSRWNKVNGTVLAGLTRRRGVEAALYLS